MKSQDANSQRLISSIRCGSVAFEQARSKFRLHFMFIPTQDYTSDQKGMAIWLRNLEVNHKEIIHTWQISRSQLEVHEIRLPNLRQIKYLYFYSARKASYRTKNMETARFYIKSLLIYWYPIRIRILHHYR